MEITGITGCFWKGMVLSQYCFMQGKLALNILMNL